MKNIEISDNKLILKSDVDSRTGNIQFDGDITIEGNVLSRYTVKSNQDIIIKSNVLGGNLYSGKNIVIFGGVDGKNISVIEAQNDVKVSYVHNATIISKEGSIYVELDVINSKLQAKEKIVITSEMAVITTKPAVLVKNEGWFKSGIINSGDMVLINTVGSKNNGPVEIIVTSEKIKNIVTKLINTEKRIQEINKQLESMSKFVNLLKILGKNIVALSDEKKAMIKKQSDLLLSLKNELVSLLALKPKLEQERDIETERRKKTAVIKVFNEIFPGAKISIDHISHTVQYYAKRVGFYKSGMIIMGKLDRLEEQK